MTNQCLTAGTSAEPCMHAGCADTATLILIGARHKVALCERHWHSMIQCILHGDVLPPPGSSPGQPPSPTRSSSPPATREDPYKGGAGEPARGLRPPALTGPPWLDGMGTRFRNGTAPIGLCCSSGHHWSARARYDQPTNRLILLDGAQVFCPEPTCGLADTDAVWRCEGCDGLFDWTTKCHQGGLCKACHWNEQYRINTEEMDLPGLKAKGLS